MLRTQLLQHLGAGASAPQIPHSNARAVLLTKGTGAEAPQIPHSNARAVLLTKGTGAEAPAP